MTLDIFLSLLGLLGGLAMFLYGMEIMGDGLKKLAGGKLESILSKLTSNKILGLFLGFCVTAVIQSSSATTVMLVGFVNSGIMNLGQTIGVIMGANIGTTVTAWLLSTSQIGGGDSIAWLSLFKPSSFTPILAVIGIAMLMMGKTDKKKNIASILLGFSVLMYGMEMMSGAMEHPAIRDAVSDAMVMFENPVMGIIMGTILTAVIQSSSASVGILQALALSGVGISFSTAIPIILGQNIGTTITPVLSSLTGNTASKRVAAACVYIKMIGVVVVYVVFVALSNIFDFGFMNTNVSPITIALVHTLFNIISTVILIPFSRLIEKLAIKTIKDSKKVSKKDETFAVLDERFLDIPSFAVEMCRELVNQMAVISKGALVEATYLLGNYDEQKYQHILEIENEVDKYEDKTSTYLVKLSSRQLSTKDSHVVTELLHCIGDLERIADHAVNIAKVAQELHEKDAKFSKDAMHDVDVISEAVREVMSLATEALKTDDLELAKRVEPLEQVIDKIKAQIRKGHIERLRQGNCTIEVGFALSDLLINYERVSDHCSNIAVCILEIANDSFETHEYLTNVKTKGENHFFEIYDEYKDKYAL